jgi:histidine kinase
VQPQRRRRLRPGPPKDVLGTSFLDLFVEEDRSLCANSIHRGRVIDQARHRHKDGRTIFVTIRISLSKYKGSDVLLVTTGDITKRLEAEQQLIQASKMATLGGNGLRGGPRTQPAPGGDQDRRFDPQKETGPLVLGPDDTLMNVTGKIDANVDRASNIIDHMRQFARKSDARLEAPRSIR